MKNLLITVPLSLICLFAQAATTPAPAPASTAAKPATAAPGAATTSAVNTSVAAAPAAAEPKHLSASLTLGAEYGIQGQQQPEGTRSQGMTYNIKPGLSYGDYTIKVDEYWDQDLVDPASGNGDAWSDPNTIITRKGWDLGKYIKLSPQASFVLPTKTATRSEVGLIYSVSAAAGLALQTKALGMDAWSFGYQLQYTKTETQYDTNAKTGAPSNNFKIRNRITFGYQITDSIAFFNLFDFRSNYSVNGVVTNSFLTLQSIGYDINENVSVSIGHNNDSPYLKNDTYEPNLKLYDEAKSNYTVGIEMNI